jgi:hypothetical protein
VYLAANGSYYEICTNSIFNGLTANPCNTNNGNPISGTGSWAINSASGNSFTLSGTAFGPTNYVSTITAPIMDASKGIFLTSQTNDGNPNSGTGVGKYQNVQTSFSIASMAGKTFKVSGFGSCTDGLRQYAFGQVAGNALAYTWTCPGGYVSGGSVTGVASSTVVAGTTIPGVVKFTDAASTDPLFIGITADSTTTGGIAMVAKVGGAACAQNNLSACTGYVKPRSFILQ